MAKLENETTKVTLTLSKSEALALREIINKISRDKSLTTLDEYRRAGQFIQLLDHNRESGEYRISL